MSEGPDSAGAEPLQAVITAARSLGLFDDWVITAGQSGTWTEYQPPDGLVPVAGTKIHVSAATHTAAAVLAACLPVMSQMRVHFKHSVTLEMLGQLNSGRGGATQVGKFLTAYPADEPTAEQLARQLHQATRQLAGPRIANERQHAAGSVVYSRYGAFTRRYLQTAIGRVVPARPGADGRLEVDDRTGDGHSPADPRRGVRVLAERYVRVQPVSKSPKGSTWLGFADTEADGELVIIKEAYAHVMQSPDGQDARYRLGQEAACLSALAGKGIAPELLDHWTDDESAFLVYRLVEGPTMSSLMNSLLVYGLRPPVTVLRSWLQSLCELLAELHSAGFVSADIKPANIIVTENGLRLIDLELAGPPTDRPTIGIGTPGYCSPQQNDPAQGRSFADDLYSLGATLLAAATCTDASMLPSVRLVARAEAARQPGNPLFRIAEKCLNDDPAARFLSADAVRESVDRPGPVTESPAGGGRSSFFDIACGLGDAAIDASVRDRAFTYWVSGHPTMNGQAVRDLYAGAAGTALFMSALAEESGRADYLDAATGCGEWLWRSSPSVPRERPMPGLYFGDCGPGMLYLKLHGITNDSRWLERAAEVSDRVVSTETESPDIMTGAAGVLLFHTFLGRSTGDREYLSRASGLAHELLSRQEREQPTWRFPPGFDSLSGRDFVGFSHGSAGIAYALAECALAAADGQLITACRRTADWIIGRGIPALPDGRGLTWAPTLTATQPHGTNWCHGPAGMVRFFLTAYELTAEPAYLETARRAGYTVAEGAPWAGTTQCHGLAGNLEVLVDLWQATGDDHWQENAVRLGENLAVYRTGDGWPSDDMRTRSWDFMVGQAGTGAAFLRLARPGSRHLVSAPRPAAVRELRPASPGSGD